MLTTFLVSGSGYAALYYLPTVPNSALQVGQEGSLWHCVANRAHHRLAFYPHHDQELLHVPSVSKEYNLYMYEYIIEQIF